MDRTAAARGWALRGIAVALLLGYGIAPTHARVDHDSEGWVQITGTGPLVGPLRLFVEAQPRIGTDADTGNVDMRTFIARGALGYAVRPNWTLWQGYGYTPTFNPDRDEHRAFQQSTYDRTIGPFGFQDRTRLEERFFQGTHDVSLRLRNLIRLTYPLPRWPAWSLVAMDELFVNLNTVSTAPVSGFDQNRFYAGVSRQLTPNLRLEVDYLNQVLNGRRGGEDTLRNSGFLWLAFTW